MSEDIMYLLSVGASPSSSVRVPGIFRTVTAAEEAYKQFYESAFSYHVVAGERVY